MTRPVIPINAEASVPCGSCHLCCKRSLVMLVPEMGDDPSQYETMNTMDVMGRDLGNGLFLKTKPNGDCHYLNDDGCSIHGHAPYLCRIYDCRAQHAMYTRNQRRALVKSGKLSKDILKRGNDLRRQVNT